MEGYQTSQVFVACIAVPSGTPERGPKLGQNRHRHGSLCHREPRRGVFGTIVAGAHQKDERQKAQGLACATRTAKSATPSGHPEPRVSESAIALRHIARFRPVQEKRALTIAGSQFRVTSTPRNKSSGEGGGEWPPCDSQRFTGTDATGRAVQGPRLFRSRNDTTPRARVVTESKAEHERRLGGARRIANQAARQVHDPPKPDEPPTCPSPWQTSGVCLLRQRSTRLSHAQDLIEHHWSLANRPTTTRPTSRCRSTPMVDPDGETVVAVDDVPPLPESTGGTTLVQPDSRPLRRERSVDSSSPSTRRTQTDPLQAEEAQRARGWSLSVIGLTSVSVAYSFFLPGTAAMLALFRVSLVVRLTTAIWVRLRTQLVERYTPLTFRPMSRREPTR